MVCVAQSVCLENVKRRIEFRYDFESNGFNVEGI